jgi:hypothetical protein
MMVEMKVMVLMLVVAAAFAKAADHFAGCLADIADNDGGAPALAADGMARRPNARRAATDAKSRLSGS